MTHVTDINDATIATYTYDATNKRVSKTAFGLTTIFIYDIFGNLIGEYTTSGGLIRDYVYLGSKPIALISLPEGIQIGPIGCPSICTITTEDRGQKTENRLKIHKSGAINALFYISPLFILALIRIYHRGRRGRIDLAGLILITGVVSLIIIMLTRAQTQQESIYYYHLDHLGTPIKMTDSNQATAWDATFDPFGKASITTSTVTNNLRFPGQYYDAETGLHYNWNRYYWPEVGRYVQVDPLGLDSIFIIKSLLNRKDAFSDKSSGVVLIESQIADITLNPMKLHLYTYAMNNPITITDSVGLIAECKRRAQEWYHECVKNYQLAYRLCTASCYGISYLCGPYYGACRQLCIVGCAELNRRAMQWCRDMYEKKLKECECSP